MIVPPQNLSYYYNSVVFNEMVVLVYNYNVVVATMVLLLLAPQCPDKSGAEYEQGSKRNPLPYGFIHFVVHPSILLSFLLQYDNRRSAGAWTTPGGAVGTGSELLVRRGVVAVLSLQLASAWAWARCRAKSLAGRLTS